MAFWTTDHLVDREVEIFGNHLENATKHASRELHMGAEAYVTGGEVGQKTILELGGPGVAIPPGQFALLLTEETVRMPNYAIGFISVRYHFKRRGLVNVSGFHVDPGFTGKLIFSVYNAGSSDIVISRGYPAFIMWLAGLEGPVDAYQGDHQHQDTIKDDDLMDLGRPLFSPAALDERLRRVEVWLEVTRTIIIGIVISAALAIGGILLRNVIDGSSGTPSPTPSVTTSLTPTSP